MEPTFISVVNSYKIYHISADEHARMVAETNICLDGHSGFCEHTELMLSRKFVVYKDQHFTYCRKAFEPLLRIIPTDSSKNYSWHSNSSRSVAPPSPAPQNEVIEYITNAYKEILDQESRRQYSRDHTLHLVKRVIVPRYWNELQASRKPVIARTKSIFTCCLPCGNNRRVFIVSQ